MKSFFHEIMVSFKSVLLFIIIGSLKELPWWLSYFSNKYSKYDFPKAVYLTTFLSSNFAKPLAIFIGSS
ncbi:hypothetical protein CJJ23_02400 [Mycoplasmopsis agassizii]|uniref:Uncharacterized protein n=1 Tax=Mycoplasmopsis agassizii TaxID=33922 RepID=A0A269TKA0_9BACT|nr:hypothetical protein [Mycoplasmopsis agassizii]PAK21368.1 hypothetical protein CJJ23_02400 [Mycoplasmopsis agassizii]